MSIEVKLREKESISVRVGFDRGDAKVEQVKTVDIIENGVTEVVPDGDKVLSKVIANVNVPDKRDEALAEFEALIDESGVLEDTEGTATEKVEQLIDKANELDVFMLSTGISFKAAKTFPNKAVVNLPNVVALNDNFSDWNTEPIPIVEELTVNAPNLTNGTLYAMFKNNYGVKKIILNLPDNCVDMRHAFAYCQNLEEVILNFSTKNVTYFNIACETSRKLKKIVGALDFSSATNVGWMFNNCFALEEVTFEPNTLSISFSFQWCEKLTSESIQSIIDGLATVETAKTLTLHKNIVLTDEQKATINAKGWTLAQ